jgi:hypothetical protein
MDGMFHVPGTILFQIQFFCGIGLILIAGIVLFTTFAALEMYFDTFLTLSHFLFTLVAIQ